MRNQEFHKGVDGLKSLGTPDLNGTKQQYHNVNHHYDETNLKK